MSQIASSISTVTTRDAYQSVLRAVKKNRNVLLVGAPGVGKTSIMKLIARFLGWNIVITTPANADPTDSKGLGFPSPDGTHAEFLAFAQIYDLINATKPTLWFIDDIGQASPAVQAAFMPWLLERRCGSHVLPECVRIVAATNSRQHKSGVAGLLEPVKSRFHKILHLTSDYNIWREDFAVPNGMPAYLIAYLDFSVGINNSSFNKFVPTSDMTNSPYERTWANAGDLINDYLEDSDGDETELFETSSLLFKDVSGAIGVAEAGSFWQFIKLSEEFKGKTISDIINDPSNGFIPKTIQGQFMVINHLAAAANDSNFDSIYIYARRLYGAIEKELPISMIHDIVLKKPDLKNTNTFIKIATSDEFGGAFSSMKAA